MARSVACSNFDHHADSGHDAALLLEQSGRRGGGAAADQQIVQKRHSLPGQDPSLLHRQAQGDRPFLAPFSRSGIPRQRARSRYRDERNGELEGHRGGQQDPARVDARDRFRAPGFRFFGQGRDHSPEERGRLQKRRHVPEARSGSRKILNDLDGPPELTGQSGPRRRRERGGRPARSPGPPPRPRSRAFLGEGRRIGRGHVDGAEADSLPIAVGGPPMCRAWILAGSRRQKRTGQSGTALESVPSLGLRHPSILSFRSRFGSLENQPTGSRSGTSIRAREPSHHQEAAHQEDDEQDREEIEVPFDERPDRFTERPD